MLTSRVPLQAVLWDFDGVLNANVSGGQFLWAAEFEADFSRPLDEFTHSVFRDPGPLLRGEADISDRIADWIEESSAATTPREVIEYWLSRDFHPDHKALALVAECKARGLRQAILSNCDSRRAAWLEALAPQMPGITDVLCSSRLGRAKPDAAAFDAARAALDLPAGAIVFVDDSPSNVNAAASLGFRTFLYSPLALDALRRTLAR